MADTEKYLKIKNLFLNALDLPEQKRNQYLKKECGQDEELYADVIEKLKQAKNEIFNNPVLGNIGDQYWDAAQQNANQNNRQENNPSEIHPDQNQITSNEPLPSDIRNKFARDFHAQQQLQQHTARNIGDYKILRVIATGGMGTVYLAIQNEPKRKVALKVMRRGISSKSSLRRFQFEAQILARLRHPNIAQIYEAGRHYEETAFGRGEGLPFFAMEYVPGAKTIIEYADAYNMPVHNRLKLMLKVCDAVHHGHQKGIIHRDLKPGNILVNASGEPKIIDFGVARVTDSDMALTTQQTNVGQLVGTLQYMSPEQCEADPEGLDIRSDVYALGVLLFELICGKTPYDLTNAAVYEAARIIREQKPQKPSTISKLIHGDLETIVLKTLEKEREQRYQSAASLKQDIQRYLNSQPIEARPPSMVYQLKMFARRNRTVFTAIVAAAVVLVVATVISLVFGIRSAKAEKEAIELSKEATRQAKISNDVLEFITRDLLSAANPNNSLGDKITVRELLDQADVNISKLVNDKETQATICTTIGIIYRTLGLYRKAESQLNNALNIHEEIYPNSRKESLIIIEELAALYLGEGKFSNAAELMYEVISLLEAENNNTVKLVRALTKLALILRLSGEITQAEIIINKACEISARKLPENNSDARKARENLALILNDNNQSEKAEIIMREVLKIHKNNAAKTTPALLLTMHRLGIVLANAGKYAEADSILTEVLKGRSIVFAKDKFHPRILSSMTYLGMVKYKNGNLDQAEKLLKNALDLRDQNPNLGKSHIETLQNMWMLADVYQEQGKIKDAENILKNALMRIQTNYKSVDYRIFGVALCQYQYALFLINNKRYTEALPLLLSSYKQLVNSYSSNNTYAQRSLKQLVELYEIQGDNEMADTYRDKIITPDRDN